MAGRPPPQPALSRDVTARSDFSLEDEWDHSLGRSYSHELRAEGGGRAWEPSLYTSLEALRAAQAHLVEEAVDCTGVHPDDATLMLRVHGWDLAAFEEAFFNDPDALRGRAGASDPEGDEAGGCGPSQLCAICFTDPGVPVLPCERRPLRRQGRAAAERHPAYCADCWGQYLSSCVRDGKHCLNLRCPTPGCEEAVRPGHFRRLLGEDSEALGRYRRFLAESLVDDSRGRLRWCPGQRCGRAAAEPGAGFPEIPCPCGVVWCYACGTDAHLPVACETVRAWEAKNRDESGDATWIRVNTKLCPRCQNPIEKNGGCMHMTCRQPGGCGHEFCWICMQSWNGHTACNARKESAEETDERLKTSSELMRYAHFYERFMAHHRAQQITIAKELLEKRDLARELSTIAYQVSEVDFLPAAVREIAASRGFLKWTYAHAYFSSFTANEKHVFEFHQAQLEENLERLSDLTENTKWSGLGECDSKLFFYELRAQLISLTDVVRKLFQHLREAMAQGTLFTGGASAVASE